MKGTGKRIYHEKDILPLNKKGQKHGYVERFHKNGDNWFKGNYINGNRIGYREDYNYKGELVLKKYYII